MMRHVNSEETNLYWQECYTWLRKNYDWPIMIVDDNSKQEFVKTTLNLVNVTVVQSKFKSRGEILALYYFHKKRPFENAIVIHDSMFIKTRFAFESFAPNRPLLTFQEHEYDKDELCEPLIKKLDNYNDILEMYRNKYKWNGCFGVMMYVTWDFLELMNKRYDLFDTIIANVDTRLNREQVERIFGCIFKIHGPGWPAVFGHIDFDRKPTFQEYKEGVHQEKPYVKVFTGR